MPMLQHDYSPVLDRQTLFPFNTCQLARCRSFTPIHARGDKVFHTLAILVKHGLDLSSVASKYSQSSKGDILSSPPDRKLSPLRLLPFAIVLSSTQTLVCLACNSLFSALPRLLLKLDGGPRQKHCVRDVLALQDTCAGV
jgi:hypothetical protein